ncbi:acyl-coenzyme A thioesterase 13-like [Papaver somniferum]|uniref:acyl-coenzyme A thioesterase 13-like n=1 Tax=Papaver somniferum TaxID=3469 RepID=UPI000E703AC5|nr:acyl-coenzyme A thioesterase 13-like [Papaver somniferum]
MNLESVKKLLETTASSEWEEIYDLPGSSFDPLIIQGIKVDLVEPGRIICSMKVPPRLLNSGNSLNGGAMASLVDIIGAAAKYTAGAEASGVSVGINISYLDYVYLDEEIEIEAKVVRVRETVGVATVELRKKKTGKIVAQGRHTMYLAVSSKL